MWPPEVWGGRGSAFITGAAGLASPTGGSGSAGSTPSRLGLGLFTHLLYTGCA